MTDTDTFMKEYPKINALYMRDQKGNLKFGEFARPEFELLDGVDWLWTEKVDGTNIRLGFDPEEVFRGHEASYIAGRTNNAQIPKDLLDALVALQQGIPWEDHFDVPVTLYGEGYGPKIQSGGKYGDAPRFVLFDVKIGRWWLDYEDVVDVGDKLGLDVVPLVFQGPVARAEHTVIRSSFRSAWGDFQPEGLVGRPPTTLFNKRGERVLCKVKCKDYAMEAEAGVL